MSANETEAVTRHHIDALEAGDLEAVMSDYTEESVLIVPGAVMRGLDAIRPAFAAAFESSFKPGSSEFTLHSLDVCDDCSIITWRITFDGGEIPFGTDTLYVRDGKIITQTGAVFMG